MSAIAPTPWLDRLGDLVRAPKDRLDADAIHDLRVAAGRLRVWLALCGIRVLQDDLRWLRRSAGPLRDLDVVLARLGSKPWASALTERRDFLLSEFAASLAEPRLDGMSKALAVLPPLSSKDARRRTAKLKTGVMRIGAKAMKAEEDLEPVHRLRRWVRRLRYAVEWQGGECSRLEELQAALGELGDLATAQRHLTELQATDGAEEDRAAIERELAKQRRRALTAWKRVRCDVEAL